MKIFLLVFVFGLVFFTFTDAFAQTIGDIVNPKIEKELLKDSNRLPGQAVVLVYSNTSWSGSATGGAGGSSSRDGTGDARYVVSCGDLGLAQGLFQKQTDGGWLAVVIIQDGKRLAVESTNAAYGIAHAVADNCSGSSGGGCLIATAAYGTELAPEVQNLREIRNKMYETEVGGEVMHAVNDFYYSFSPTVSDWERENVIFKETMRVLITPSMTSFTMLDHQNIDSESGLVGYVVSIVALNVGMYFVAPAVVIVGIKKKF